MYLLCDSIVNSNGCKIFRHKSFLTVSFYNTALKRLKKMQAFSKYTLETYNIGTVHHGFFTYHSERESIFKEPKQMIKVKILRKDYLKLLNYFPSTKHAFSLVLHPCALFFWRLTLMLSTIPPKRLALTSLLKSTSIPSILRLLSTWVSCCYLKFDMSPNGLILYIKTVHPADILILLTPPFSQPRGSEY